MKQPTPKPHPRRWLFRLVAVVLLPLLALCLAEGVLRLAGYGYDTHLFEKQTLHGAEFFLNNEHFSDRFFPPELARWPSPVLMPAVKAPGTYRIFIMGESAAQGDPQPAFGPARYLEALLRERFPRAHFEIVNVGITAINSHVILPIARECARHDGDLWIVYMGNNEMVGPFGAATVFGAQAPPLFFVRLNLALQQTRLGQALMDLSRRLHQKKSAPAHWGGMEMFLGQELRPNDPRRERVYRNFTGNLRDIVRAGLDAGPRVLLSTVAVNLKDCPPFASPDPAGPAAEFRLGQSLLPSAAAREHLQKACDDDGLSFRADSRINGAIRDAAAAFAGPNLLFCDAARDLAAAQPDGVCGQETFYEHVHFNFPGAYHLALLWAAQTEKCLPDALRAGAASSWASQEICDARLGITAWNRSDVLHDVLGRLQKPPLNSQSNNPWRIELLQHEIDGLRAAKSAAAAPAARALYEDAIQRAPADYYLPENYAEFLELTGDLRGAAAQWRRGHELMPRNPLAYLSEGQLLMKLGQAEPARAALQEAVRLHPRYSEAWLELGKLDASANHLDLALEKYRHAAALQPSPEAYLCIGKALSLQKHSPESLASFRLALAYNPSYWEAHYALGGELGLHDQFAEARHEFEEVVRLNPNFPMGHLNLGVALLKLNDYPGAREQFNETLRLDPANQTARAYLASARQP
ncbi:MAG TPA: tetratricopeptide repeat protein [Verrucomicrobiae bacterium]|nr:tetratricopeptide repeat protein [Verrucomicrobiae bacterium]